jgi:hypothetical protein
MNRVLTLLIACALSSIVRADLDYRQQSFLLPGNAEQLVVADINADGLKELITVVDQSLRIYLQDANGFDFDSGFTTLAFTDEAIGWDVAYGHSRDNNAAIVTLHNGAEARAWTLSGNGELQEELIASNLPGFISKGVNRLHFSRDINADSHADLVIPGAGVINILINDGAGQFQAPLTIRSNMRLRTQLDINRFNRSAGQAVRIPVLELRDLNGDGADDLVSRTEEVLAVFLADPAGENYFPSSPSYALDILAIEEQLGEFDIDNLDFSNLTGILALTHEEILDDVNNDGIEDLLLREAGKVSLFRGLPDGMDLTQPQQVLRSGGNVLSTFLYDENEDGSKDLWLWRVEPISVGDIFVWLALSGSVAVEAFIYPNDGERFARRPSRKVSVNLRFPSVMRLANAYQDLSSQARELENSPPQPSLAAHLNGQLDRQELLLMVNDQVQVFLDRIEPENQETEFLGGLGYTRQRDEYTIDIGDIINDVARADADWLQAISGREPDSRVQLGEESGLGDLVSARLNDDDYDDVFIFTGHDASQIRGLLLLSN